ncbi:hypothetical protein DFP75_102251 [Marinomonas alcarazii]|uniref:Outer membrane beta-barrel porin/alpha-amylase n=1 Tax=Marinomonas alcarazii TaxID=491949 RepID=A0A318V5R4_9GAMM|nr:transporter [Marinomonas alcarazii]PYF83161.1 hypothetical protein DFP75_102251 [Marinomonas alcarazii]
MKILKSKLLLATMGGATLFTLPNLAFATENGAPTTAMGVYDFGAGFMPPATDVGAFGLRTAYYSSNSSRNASGNDNGTDFSLDVLSVGIAYIKMTNHEVFGAKYGFSTVVPFFSMDASLKIPVASIDRSTDVTKQADLQVTPLILQWNLSPNLAMNAQFQIQAPTGDYDKDRLVSPGLNHWAFSPIYNVTYISDSGFEVSSSFELDINTKNSDTDYKNGIEYRHEFAVGKHINEWTLGLGGYYYRQLTDDKTYSGYTGQAIVDGNRAETLAAGPAISYFKPGLPMVSFHAYKEFKTSNRAQGYNLALRVSQSF